MPEVHRDGDSRKCGAVTKAACANVFTNNRITSVDGNPNSHGGGSLNAANPNVFIGNILVVILLIRLHFCQQIIYLNNPVFWASIIGFDS